MSSSSFALEHLSLFPDTLAEKRILCFETKQQSDGTTEVKTSAHLEFSDSKAMIAFYESTATKIYKQTTRYDDMKNEQARLYKEHLEQMMKEELSGGEGDAATKMQNAIHASEHKEIVAQEETRKLAIAPYGNEDGALALLTNESDDGMDVQQKLRLAKMVRDIMHTVLCGIVLPTLEGNTSDATGAALGLLQGLMGTEIVGHMLRFATSVYVTVGSLNDTILGYISKAMGSMFGAESWIASSCTMFFQYLSSLTGQIATVGALITAGTAFLYRWLPDAAQEYIREWVIKPIQSRMEPVLQWFQGKSVGQIQIRFDAGLPDRRIRQHDLLLLAPPITVPLLARHVRGDRNHQCHMLEFEGGQHVHLRPGGNQPVRFFSDRRQHRHESRALHRNAAVPDQEAYRLRLHTDIRATTDRVCARRVPIRDAQSRRKCTFTALRGPHGARRVFAGPGRETRPRIRAGQIWSTCRHSHVQLRARPQQDVDGRRCQIRAQHARAPRYSGGSRTGLGALPHEADAVKQHRRTAAHRGAYRLVRESAAAGAAKHGGSKNR